MAIHISRKYKVEQKGGHDVTMVFTAMIKSRILIDFLFYKKIEDGKPDNVWKNLVL